MTESTQIQTTENNNTRVTKMEPPPPLSINSPSSPSNITTSTNNNNNINNNNNNPNHSSLAAVAAAAAAAASLDQQHYALKWNDFQTSILSSFQHLRDEEEFVDVTLACEQKSFTAHKVVLSACSPYFKKLLKANPCDHPIIILRDVKSEDIENMLKFMYNGEVHVGHEQLPDFLKTVQLLQVRGLADVNGSNSRTTAVPSNVSSSTPTSQLSSLTNSLPNPLQSSTPSVSTPAIQELKASPSPVSRVKNNWETDRGNHLTPPPQKRIKSADLFRAQHGISPERFVMDRDFPLGQHPLTRERDRSREQRDISRETSNDRSLDLRDSLLGQALESGQGQAQSQGEDSNSSDTEPSDRGDGNENGGMDSLNGSHSFPSAFLGLQGLLPGPSGMHGANDFGSRRSLEMRVRATDPRPCPKCGKIYRSAHTLRTHLEDKHTVCPGYRCVLCGTVAKSRNSLHSHMSRQHRGISTKDLPVLPMPSPFDPELASRLLAKAGVKISAAELRARASPTGGAQRGGSKLDLRSAGDHDASDEDDDDPEDLTTGGFGSFSSHGGNGYDSRYNDGMMNYGHPNASISRLRESGTPKSMDIKDGILPPSAATGQSLLDTYLQFIADNPFGMGMSQEHAAAALHAAKLAQLNAMTHGLDKLPPGLLPPHLSGNGIDGRFQLPQQNGLTIEAIHRSQTSSPLHNGPTDIRRDSSEPMDLGLDNHNQSGSGGHSDTENGNYSEDEGVHNA